jgi:hypothetical protein
MPQALFPTLSLSLTDTFARYTGAARHGINAYTSIMSVMEGLIQDEAAGVQLVVANGSKVGSVPLADIVRETLASPLYLAGLKDEAKIAKISDVQAGMLQRIGAYVATKKLSDRPLDIGQAYLLSTMVLDRLHDRQPVRQADSTVGTYDVQTWSPGSSRSGLMFAL